ncbi:GNAT family N-acetyltransferase [Halorubrum gandharaense]
MEFALLGFPEDEPTLRLDYRAFAYAGKFVVGATGKAVWRTAGGSPAAPEWEPDDPLPDSVDPGAFDDDVLAAVSFSTDRTNSAVCRLRYVTVHRGRRGGGLGPALVRRTVDALAEGVAGGGSTGGSATGEGATGEEPRACFDTVRIAVNNPFAYEALYKAGFAFTGRETGIAELVLDRPVEGPAPDHDDRDRYQAGLDQYRARDLGDPEASFLADREGADPPAFAESHL